MPGTRYDNPDDRARATATIADFAHAARTHLPRRLRQVRAVGASVRAFGKGKPKR